MRLIIGAFLLAGTAVPAVAAADPAGSRDDRRSEAAERVREARAERAEQRGERKERVVEQVRSVRNEAAGDNGLLRVDRAERGPAAVAANPLGEAREQRRRERAAKVGAVPTPEAAGDSVAGWRQRERSRPNRPAIATGEVAVPARTIPTQRIRTADRDGIGGQVAEQVRRSGLAAALANPEVARRWREDWRRDGRHDWRSYRDRNRSLFRFGYYYDPFGYGYRRFGLGYTLWPSYYSNRYWLNDPWQYRLPYVGGSYRWVRYWDDALLIDLRTGQVVDAIYDVFW